MFTLPVDATDDDLRDGVIQWFTLVALGNLTNASEFLDRESQCVMTVDEFNTRVADLTSGGKLSIPEAITLYTELDGFPIDGPSDMVCRWIPGPDTTEKHPEFIADILHTIPVDGTWSDIDASFFVRRHEDQLTLQLRDVLRLSDDRNMGNNRVHPSTRVGRF